MQSLAIKNPRTGQCDFDLPMFSSNEVKEQVASLRDNQTSWQEFLLQDRIDVVAKLSKTLESNKEKIVEALINDTGRFNESTLELEVTINGINRWCNQAIDVLTIPDERRGEIPFLSIKQSIMPYEVVGIISPWNFPLLLSLVDAIPALLAGCSVILKPSEVTSRFVKPLQKAIEVIPELSSVFKIVTGAGETGQSVINEVDIVCFTGSVATGRKVAEVCAKRFIPSFLELGGKDPAIVCHDADVELAAKALCWGSMVNAGQSCMSLERVYVHQDIAELFINAIKFNVSQLTHNYPNVEQGDLGPIISEKQVEIIKYQLSDAKAKGAEFLCGGEVIDLGGGRYCQPTLLTKTTPDMAIIKEETFAAILPIVIVSTDQQAVRLANDSQFGLSGAVFSQNIEYAEEIANQLQAGAISINDASLTALVHEMEKQSFKFSGLGGSRMGKDSIFRFVRKKAFIRNTGVASPWWF